MRAWLEEVSKDRGGALRLLLIGVLTLALLIPLGMVDALIEERGGRRQVVLDEIAAQQGGEQRIVGPVMVVPYTQEIAPGRVSDDGAVIRERKTVSRVAVILPETLSSTAALTHEVRQRGIYEAPVYKARLKLAARFKRADLAAAIPNLVAIDWAKAAVAVSLSDIGGLVGVDSFTVGGKPVKPAAGAPAYAGDLLNGGPERRHIGAARTGAMHAKLALKAALGLQETLDVEVGLTLNGSQGLYVAPVAGETRIEIGGDWPHPSFQGAPLPETRTVSSEGFEASWRVPGLAKGYGALWFGPQAHSQIADAVHGAVGFRHANPDDLYVAATRSVKYGVLFIALTFIACFVLERFGGGRLHPAQYGLVGLSLALFYLLTLALAEQIGFAPAYVAAALVIAGLNGGYVGVALASLKRGLGVALALGLLYGAFFVMLTSEDNALLLGSGLLLLGIAFAMAATARINSVSSPQSNPAS